jgi:hypothetical protein
LDLVALLVGQAIATPSAAEGRLNSPRLKQKRRAVGSELRAAGVVRRDPEQQQGGIRIARILRDMLRGHRR